MHTNSGRPDSIRRRGVGKIVDQRLDLFLAGQRQRDIHVVHAAVPCEPDQRIEIALHRQSRRVLPLG